MKQKSHALSLCLTVLVSLPLSANAGEWGLGLGVAVQQQPQKGIDNQVFVVPFPSYQGERLNLGFGTFSYALNDSNRIHIAVEGGLRFDGYDPDDSSVLLGLEERDPTFDMGFSITSTNRWGVTSLSARADVLGVHKGKELSASYQYPIQSGNWTLIPTLEVDMLSSNIVDYYYGVRSSESTFSRPAYSGDSVTNVSAGLSMQYRLNSNWDLVGGVEYTTLGSEITDSPIIMEDHQSLLFTGLVYRF